MRHLRPVAALVAALGLGACAASPAPLRTAAPMVPECGVDAKPLRQMTVTVTFKPLEDIRRMQHGAAILQGAKLNGLTTTTHLAGVRSHFIVAPLPRSDQDTFAWQVLFHELRHANGEVHDIRGCWLDRPLPPSPNLDMQAQGLPAPTLQPPRIVTAASEPGSAPPPAAE